MADLSAAQLAAWEHLEDHAADGNMFLSPSFVLPALRHLTPKRRPFALLATRGRALVGVGVFEERLSTRRIPLPHLIAYATPHTLCNGLLIHQDCAPTAMNALWAYLHQQRHRWHALELFHRRIDRSSEPLFDAVTARHRLRWHEYARRVRTLIVPAQTTTAALHQHWSKSRRKKLQQKRRQLSAHGNVDFQLVWNERLDPRPVERFLRLEAMGWKHDNGSALASFAANETFYREMVASFARRKRSYFTELTAGTDVVAASSNFVSGTTGFAFKIGWNPAHARCSPGVLHEQSYIETAATELTHLREIDGCTDDTSYVAEIWPGRGITTSGAWALSRLGHTVLSALAELRRHRLPPSTNFTASSATIRQFARNSRTTPP